MKEILDFLRQLAANNNRDWFHAHKADYDRVRRCVDEVAAHLIAAVAEADPRAERLTTADCTYRIYRDTRFSTDKTPYKTHVGIFVNPPYGKKYVSAGYYLHIEPDNCFFGMGAVCIPADKLKAIRQDIYDNVDEYREIVESPEFKAFYPTVGWNLLKTAPKGFPKDWPYVAYLRPRDFVTEYRLTEKQLTAPDYIATLRPAIAQAKRLCDFYNYTLLPDEE